MKNTFVALASIAFAASAFAAPDVEPTTVLKRAYPIFTWQPASVVEGDFTCSGKPELAALGTSDKETAVAVFTKGNRASVRLIRFSSELRDPGTANIAKEDLDFDPKELESQLGQIPAGLIPSRTCSGLTLSDQNVDSAHIYWNKQKKRFESWSN